MCIRPSIIKAFICCIYWLCSMHEYLQ